MTRRERLEMVIRGEITPELIEECKVELAKLNERSMAALAKSKTTENYLENKEWEPRICAGLENGPLTVDDLARHISWPYSRQRLTAVCTNLAREGKIQTTEVKIKGKGRRRAYYV